MTISLGELSKRLYDRGESERAETLLKKLRSYFRWMNDEEFLQLSNVDVANFINLVDSIKDDKIVDRVSELRSQGFYMVRGGFV